MRSKLTLFIRVLVGIGLTIVILASIDLSEVVSSLTSVDPRWLLVLCIVAISSRTVKSYKWWLLLRARGIFMSPWQTMRLSFEGNVIGIFTPASVGSDFYRIAALSNLRKHKDVISTLMIERLIGFTLLIVAAAITLPFSAKFIDAGTYHALLIAIALFFALGCAVLGLLQLRSFKEYVNNVLIPAFPFFASVKSVLLTCLEFRRRGSLMMSFAMLTALEIVALVIISYAAARSLHIDVPFLFWLSVIPFMQVLIRLPVSFQALGIQEGLYAYTLILAGFSAADGLSISIVLRIVEIALILLPGVLLLSTRSKLPKPKSESVQKDQNPG